MARRCQRFFGGIKTLNTIRRIVFGAFIVLACSLLAVAQDTASVTGTITDSSGAVVEGATVTVRDLGSNAARTVTSTAAGSYTVPDLPAGNYEVTVEKQNFKQFRVPHLQVTVAQVLTVNAKLEPGAASEEIEVRGDEVAPIDLQTAQVSNVVEQQQIQALPLITRDPYSLVLLSPGAIQTNSSLGGFSVNGARERDNNFLLDGVDNNDTSVPGIPDGLIAANPEATEEFRVITNNFLPEYGRDNGAIIDVVTKSGTNSFHGNAYWYGRYNGFGGARDYFNPAPDPMNPYVRNQFGFSVGGPIVKDKTFFFINNEFDRFRTTLTNSAIVPTAAFKSGVFTFQGSPIDLTSPSSPNNPEGLTLDPLVASILSKYPNPNGPAVDDIRGLYFYPSSSKENVWNLTSKIDEHLTDRNTLSFTYDWNQFNDPNPFHDDFLPSLGAVSSAAHVRNISATLSSTLRPTLLNQARFGFNRLDDSFGCGGLSTFDSIGATDAFGRARDFTMPNIAGFGCQVLGDSNGQFRRTGTWSWGDNLTWIKGEHTFKFGAEFRRVYENGFDAFSSRDTATFSGFLNFGVPFVNVDPNNPCDPTTGNFCGSTALQDMADMLFGVMDTESQAQFFNHAGAQTATDIRNFRYHEYGFFAQDSWKFRPNLTLDFGARYEFNGVPFETTNTLASIFTDPSGTAPFTFQPVGPGTGHLLYNNDFSGIEPRLGFAWDPFKTGKTSVRGGFGLFRDRIFGNLVSNTVGNPPYQQTFQGFPIIGNNFTPETVPLPSALTPSPVVDNGAGIFPVLIDRNLSMPYSENWNFGFQRELPHQVTLEMNYVGVHSLHEFRVVDGNPPQPALVQQLLGQGVSPATLQFTTLWFGQEFGILPFDAVNNNAFFQASVTKSIGSSIYHGLQVNLTKRMSDGFQIQGAYTYSHSIDDASDPLVPGENNRSFPRNSFALQNERGNSDFDIRHHLVINYIWALPVGKGTAHLNSGVVGKALQGWQWSGITTFQSGHPYDIFYNVDTEHTGLSSRATLIGSTALTAGHPKTETGPPLSAFCSGSCQPPFGVPGNIGRNHFYGPGMNEFDMVMAKNTVITERLSLEFRCEAYNVFNHTLFDQPDNLLQDGSAFGFSTATLSRPDATTSARQLQFAMKLLF